MTAHPRDYALIACDVFADEIPSIAKCDPVNADSTDAPWKRIAWLEMGLHDRPDSLRNKIQSLVDDWDPDPAFSGILLAYGMCGNGLIGLQSRSKTLVLPRAHDCISILMGSRETHQAVLRENPGTYFYSPGWIRGKRTPGPDREGHLRDFYGQRYPEDPELVDDLVEADALGFSHHNCAAYVDITQNQDAENYCRSCARHLGWEFRKLHGDARLLTQFLAGNWADEDFLIVPPGHRVERASDEKLVMAVSSANAK